MIPPKDIRAAYWLKRQDEMYALRKEAAAYRAFVRKLLAQVPA